MSMHVTEIVIAAALLVVAFGFIVLETAINRVSRVRAESLRLANGRRHALEAVVTDRARYVNVLLLLHLVATTVATVLFAVAVEPVWLAALVMVVVGFIALGVAPRTIGRQHADVIAKASASFVYRLAILLGPISGLLIVIGNAVTPGRGYKEGPFASAAELRDLVEQAESVIDEDEREMLQSVFELGDTVAREVMVPRTEMVFIESTKSLRQALSLALRSGFSRIPVVGQGVDDVVGVIYLKDVARRAFEHRDAEQSERVESLMRPALMVPDSKGCDELLREMQASRRHLAILVDEYGGVAGLVTIEDILEEIVGQITDEYDLESPDIEKLGDGRIRVSARFHIEDLADELEVELDADEEGVDTIGGLFASRLGVVPIPGTQIEVGGWRLIAESAMGRRNQVATVLIERIGSESSHGEGGDSENLGGAGQEQEQQ
jgi:CBS domain containing-hemolysin-like protein